MTKLTIELDVVATCLVCQLADGRVAVMHDTAKGEVGPKLHSIQDGGDAFIEAAVSEVLTAALQDPTPKRSKRKKGVLKKDEDAKDAIAKVVGDLPAVGKPYSLDTISRGLGLTHKRTAKLLSEMCKEVPLRVGPMGDDGWVPADRFRGETSGGPVL